MRHYHDALFQDYDYDIAMSSGGNASPMLDFAHRVVASQDGHSKCPRGSRSPVMVIFYFNVQGAVDPRDGHCLL